MRPRSALAGILVVGSASLGAWFAATVAGWVVAPWVDELGLDELGPWSPDMDLDATFRTFPTPGGPPPSVRLLEDNELAWVERWRLLAVARDRIDAASFIVRDDVFGLSFLGHLLARKSEGIRVRLLVDAHGTKMARNVFTEDYLDEVAGAGIDVRVYRPLPQRIATAVLKLEPAAAIASEHDKLILVDRQLALLGGRNVGAEYYADHDLAPTAFHDVDVLVEGAATCRALERAYDAEFTCGATKTVKPETVNLSSQSDELLGAYRAMNAWLHGRPQDAADAEAAPWLAVLATEHPGLRGALNRSRPPAARAEVRLLDSAPRHTRADDAITIGLRRLLASAKQTVLIESPYLVLSEEAVKLLVEAGERGVAITIVTNSPSSSDNAVSQAFFMEQWPEILARVPNMRLFVRGDGHNLHGKTAVFDDYVSVVSTYNLDPISIFIQGEVALVATSPEFAARVAAPARRMIGQGAPTTHEYQIVRDDDGRPVLDGDGKPQVVFGPQHHSDPEAWTALAAWWKLLRTMEDVGGFDPIF
jgi:cardiolipin synthase C